MDLAIILWVYKDLDVSLNRAEWLRRLNPGAQIFCLFGGPVEESPQFEEAISPLVDDFYVFRKHWSPTEKWLQGDKMLTIWYSERGQTLEWDTVFVAQWDLLLLKPALSVCGTLRDGQLILPGLRRIAEVEHFWYWLSPNQNRRAEYDEFVHSLTESERMPEDPLCCNFLACALPRKFLEKYCAEAPDIGFLEYKLPMMAQAWGFSFCTDHELNPVWAYEGKYPRLVPYLATLHAEKKTVFGGLVGIHALIPGRARAFHPYHGKLPTWLSRISSW